MSAKHTPHPVTVADPVQWLRTFALQFKGETRASMEHCADRLTAAPDLLDALKSAPKTAHPSDERGPCLCSSCEWSRNALALIAKAEGQA